MNRRRGRGRAARRSLLGAGAPLAAVLLAAPLALRLVPLPTALFNPPPASIELTDRYGEPLREVSMTDLVTRTATLEEIPQHLMDANARGRGREILAPSRRGLARDPARHGSGCAIAALSPAVRPFTQTAHQAGPAPPAHAAHQAQRSAPGPAARQVWTKPQILQLPQPARLRSPPARLRFGRRLLTSDGRRRTSAWRKRPSSPACRRPPAA